MAQDLIQTFESERPKYEAFKSRLNLLLAELVAEAGIEIHAIEHRTKTTSSFAAKVSQPGNSYASLNDVGDIVGLRVICHYSEDVARVATLINSEFDVSLSQSRDKLVDLAPDQFGYRSLHFVVALSPTRAALAEWRTHANKKAEIQVRTVLQHAWAAISHALQYKSEREVPSAFRRRLSRLAGILELADAEFSGIRQDQAVARREIAAGSVASKDSPTELNKDTLDAFLGNSDRIGELLSFATRAGFSVSPDLAPISFDSEIIDAAMAVGIKSIEALDTAFVQDMDSIGAFFERLYGKGRLGMGWRTNRGFLVLLALLFLGRKTLRRSYFSEQDWSENVVSQFLEAADITG